MILRIAVSMLFSLVLAGSVSAQSCTVPNTLTNGTNADATQVMANFNALLSCVNSPSTQTVLRSYLAGLTLSTSGSSSSFAVAPGAATSDDTSTAMTLASSSTKTTAAWSVGSGNGALDTGSIAANTWYHVFLIERTDTGVVDVLISQSATSPTLPASYTKKRRIGSMKFTGAVWAKFSQIGDEFLWDVPINDVNSAGFNTTSTLYTLSVPTGVQVNALFRATLLNSSGAVNALIQSPDEATAAVAVPTGNFNLSQTSVSLFASAQFNVRTNTSGQVRAVAGGGTSTFQIATNGWIDRRGRDN